MAAVFLVADAYREVYPWVGFVRAFAEASMVGGLADWFAVTALFRHPLGIPIPHTAIVPNNKARIAENIAGFLRRNFLVPTVIARRLEHMDFAGAAARRLAKPTGGGRLRGAMAELARNLVASLDDAAMRLLLRGQIDKRLRGFDIATTIAAAIDSAVENRRHGALVDAGLRWVSRALADNEEMIRAQLRERTNFLVRLAGLDAQIADQIIGGLNRLIAEMAEDPAHPMRSRATERLIEFAAELRTDPALRAKVEGFRDEMLNHPAVTGYVDGVWTSLQDGLMRAADSPDMLSDGPVGGSLSRLGAAIEGDAALKARINGYARRAVVATVAGYGDQIAAVVSDTVKGWESAAIVDKLEVVVGRDLQYIRMNGTIVGGLAGIVIYSVSLLLHG